MKSENQQNVHVQRRLLSSWWSDLLLTSWIIHFLINGFQFDLIIVRVAFKLVVETQIVSSIENQIRPLPYRWKFHTLLHRVGDSSTLLAFLQPIIKSIAWLVILSAAIRGELKGRKWIYLIYNYKRKICMHYLNRTEIILICWTCIILLNWIMR